MRKGSRIYLIIVGICVLSISLMMSAAILPLPILLLTLTESHTVTALFVENVSNCLCIHPM